MTIIRNVVRSITRPIVTGVVRSDLVQRYFTFFDSGVNAYGEPTSTPAITRIVMDVYPTNGNAGLPTGAPAVTNNIWQTIDFVFIGNLPDIGRNGAVYFDGYISNLFAYNGASLVVNSPMDDAPSATEFANLADPANPIIKRNIAESEVKPFDQGADGWTGEELWTYGDYNYTGSEPEFSLLIGEFSRPGDIVPGRRFKWAYSFSESNDSTGLRFRLGDVASSESASGDYAGVKDVTVGDDLYFQTVGSPTPSAGSFIRGISTKEFLEVAS